MYESYGTSKRKPVLRENTAARTRLDSAGKLPRLVRRCLTGAKPLARLVHLLCRRSCSLATGVSPLGSVTSAPVLRTFMTWLCTCCLALCNIHIVCCFRSPKNGSIAVTANHLPIPEREKKRRRRRKSGEPTTFASAVKQWGKEAMNEGWHIA